VLFGTETGMAEEIAYMVAWDAVSRGFTDVKVSPADDVPVEQWGADGTPVLFIVSTTGQGEMPATIRKSWTSLRTPGQAPPTLSPALRYAVFGLGDSSYWKFNFSGKMLHNLLKKMGADPIVHRGLGDEDDGQGHYQALMPWLEEFFGALGYKAPQTSEAPDTPVESTTPAEPVPTPLYLPNIVENRFNVTVVKSPSSCTTAEKEPTPTISTVTDVPSKAHSTAEFDFSKFVPVTVTHTSRMTDVAHFQEVRHIEFTRPNKFDFDCGDVLGVLSPNTDEAVENALRVLGLGADDSITVSLSHDLSHQQSRSFLNFPRTAASLLRYHYDLGAPAPQSFLRQLARAATDPEERERLAELSAPTKLVEYINYCYRERRTCVEVLEDFPNIKIPAVSFFSHCKLMACRYFSISSAPTADKDILSLTVAKFEVTTPYGRERAGLCSSYLCSRKVGDVVHVFLDKRPFHIPHSKPCLLIGPGTGVAPLRSVIRERTYFNKKNSETDEKNGGGGNSSAVAQTLLLFGCRNEAKDYLYGKEYPEEVGLTVVTAFSRDIPNRKVYVQHKMTETSPASKIFNILKAEGHIIVCGNAKHMPSAVFKALSAIMVAGKVDEEDAEDYLNAMKADKSLMFDTWSV